MWPSLTQKLTLKKLSTSIAIQIGRMKQEQQGLYSTKHLLSPSLSSTIDECHLQEFDTSRKRTHDVVHTMCATTDKVFVDVTRRFPCKSSRGNEHVLVANRFDRNAILDRNFQKHQASITTKTWKHTQDELTIAIKVPNTWVFDNKTSHEL